MVVRITMVVVMITMVVVVMVLTMLNTWTVVALESHTKIFTGPCNQRWNLSLTSLTAGV